MTRNIAEEKKARMTIVDKTGYDEQKKRLARAFEIISTGEFSGHGFGGSVCERISEYALETKEDRIAREAREALEGKPKRHREWDVSEKQRKYIDGDITLDQFCDPSM